MVPAHALLIELSEPPPGVEPVLRPRRGPLSLVVRNAAKPSRPDAECWVAHTTGSWSRQRLEHDPSSLVDALVAAFSAVVGLSTGPVTAQVHRWRFARPDVEVALGAWQAGFGLDPSTAIGVCGDWCAGGGVEAAWSSGQRLARAFLAMESAS